MILLARILAKEAAEFARSRALLLLCFVAPAALMLLVGNLNVRAPVIRVAIVADLDESLELQSELEELSDVEVVRWPTDKDTRSRSVRENIDLVIIRESGEGQWHFYSPLTSRYRLQLSDAVVQDLALSMVRDAAVDGQLRLIRQLAESVLAGTPTNLSGASPEIPAAPAEVEKSQADKPTASKLIESLKQEVKAGSSVPIPVLMAMLSSRLVPYFPSSNVDRSIVPGFIALIAVFLPFLLASGGLVKEFESGTMEALILAVRRNWFRVTAGKLLWSVCVGMITTLLLLVVARTAYGFGIKPGIAPVLAVQFLAALVSALLGLSISALIKSQQTAYLTSALYLVGLILVTGMIYPIEQADPAVMLVSYVFPLTFSGPPFGAWMTQGADAVINHWQISGLLGQFAVSISLCFLALRRARRRL